MHKHPMRTHADDGKIYKTTSDVAACSPKFGMAVAWPLPVAHVVEHCQEVGATPGMPMSTLFILSARSKDRELKSTKTVRIPGPVGDDDAGATGSRSSTQSGHGSNVSCQSDPLLGGCHPRRGCYKTHELRFVAGLAATSPGGLWLEQQRHCPERSSRTLSCSWRTRSVPGK